jgi:hypothetical protein
MINVRDVDRLVISDDAIAARVWPVLGPRVRAAYTADRGSWVTLRQKAAGRELIPQGTLVAQQKVFAGWARAFRAATGNRSKVAATKGRRPAPAPITPPPATAVPPPLTTTKPARAGAGAAIAGAVALAGLLALAARKKRP